MDTAEEAYVRCDVACGSPACRSCAPTSPALPAAPRHLLLPDAATLVGCLELFELPEVEGAVLLSSVLREVGVAEVLVWAGGDCVGGGRAG